MGDTGRSPLNGRQSRDKGMYLHLKTDTVICTFRSYLLLVSSQLDRVDGEKAGRCGMGWLCQGFPRGWGDIEKQENREAERGVTPELLAQGAKGVVVSLTLGGNAAVSLEPCERSGGVWPDVTRKTDPYLRVML